MYTSIWKKSDCVSAHNWQTFITYTINILHWSDRVWFEPCSKKQINRILIQWIKWKHSAKMRVQHLSNLYDIDNCLFEIDLIGNGRWRHWRQAFNPCKSLSNNCGTIQCVYIEWRIFVDNNRIIVLQFESA